MKLLAVLARIGLLLLRRRWAPGKRRTPGRRHMPAPEAGSVIAGKAWVTDGDSLRVSGHRVRFSGLDAPELDQWAKHRDGYWFKHGKRVKRALIRAVGGRHVEVSVKGIDRHGRVLGRVTCDGKDVGAWLVRNGHAVAAYGDLYKGVEQEARREKRGLWSHEVAFDPRYWRRKQEKRGRQRDEDGRDL